jgi:hypothetical protein
MKKFILVLTLILSIFTTSSYALEYTSMVNLDEHETNLQRISSNLEVLIDRAINFSNQINLTNPGEDTKDMKSLKDDVNYYQAQILTLRNSLDGLYQKSSNHLDKSNISSLLVTTSAYLSTVDDLNSFIDSKGTNAHLKSSIEKKFIGDSNLNNYKSSNY